MLEERWLPSDVSESSPVPSRLPPVAPVASAATTANTTTSTAKRSFRAPTSCPGLYVGTALAPIRHFRVFITRVVAISPCTLAAMPAFTTVNYISTIPKGRFP